MIAAVITDQGQILYAHLNAIGELEPADMESPGTALGSEFEPQEEEPTALAGIPVVGLTADRRTWVEKLGDKVLGCGDPFDHLNPVDIEDVEIVEWYNNSTIARIELPWQDIGSPARRKNFHELEVTVDRDARAYLGVYCETESGVRAYRWKGLVHGRKTPVRVGINMAGTRLRVRLCAIVFNGGRFLIRDLRIGYTAAGQD